MFQDPSKDDSTHSRWQPKSYDLAPNDKMIFRKLGLYVLTIQTGNVRFEMLYEPFGLDITQKSEVEFAIRTPVKIIAGDQGTIFTITEVYYRG